jgi:hypothetical protein
MITAVQSWPAAAAVQTCRISGAARASDLTARARARQVARLRTRLAWWQAQGLDASHIHAELEALTGEPDPGERLLRKLLRGQGRRGGPAAHRRPGIPQRAGPRQGRSCLRVARPGSHKR